MKTKMCYGCNGYKKKMGLGCLWHDCDICNGVGYIQDTAESVQKEIPIVKRRRQRIKLPESTLTVVGNVA